MCFRISVPDYFTDPTAMVELMRAEAFVVGPSGTDRPYPPIREWGSIVCGKGIRAVGTTPMEAVAEAAYTLAMSKEQP